MSLIIPFTLKGNTRTTIILPKYKGDRFWRSPFFILANVEFNEANVIVMVSRKV